MTTVPPSVHARGAAAAERLRTAGLSWPLAWMGLLAVVLLWTRLVGLDQSFYQDEVFTVRQYVIPGPDGFLFSPYNPNNHLLFSWLTWITTSVLGQSEALDRIWAVFPGLAAVGLLGWWAWRRLGPWTAVIVVFIMTIAPLNLLLMKQARGYGLTSLAFVLLLIASDRVLMAPSRRSFAAWGAAGFVGMAAHVVFTLAFLGSAVGLALVVARRRTVLVVVAMVGAAVAVFYAPLLSGMVDDFYKYFATTLPDKSYLAARGSSLGLVPVEGPHLAWHGPVTGPADLGAAGVELMVTGDSSSTCQSGCFRGADFVRYALPALALIALGAVVLWRAHGLRLLVLITMPLLLTFTALSVTGVFVVDRFLSHLLPAVAVLMAVAIAAIGSALWRTRLLRGVVVVLGSVLALSGLMQVIDLNSRWVAVPFEDMKQVGAIVNQSGVEPVVTNSSAPDGLLFYIGEDIRRLSVDELRALFCDRAATFVYVDHPLRSIRPDTECLYARRAAKVRVNQRGRGGFLDVWIVPPPP
jgi:hypothetical protein